MAVSLSAVVVRARSAVRRAIQNVATARVRVATAVIGCQSRCRLAVRLEATAPAAAPAAIPPNIIPPNAITPNAIAPNTAAADRARERVWFIAVVSYLRGDGKAETHAWQSSSRDDDKVATAWPPDLLGATTVLLQQSAHRESRQRPAKRGSARRGRRRPQKRYPILGYPVVGLLTASVPVST